MTLNYNDINVNNHIFIFTRGIYLIFFFTLSSNRPSGRLSMALARMYDIPLIIMGLHVKYISHNFIYILYYKK